MSLPNPQPSDYKELLEVFRVGLIQGIVTKQEIVAWADRIINAEGEPDYFFIELSLCSGKSVNDVMEIIGQVPDLATSAITIRPLFGLLYHQLITGELDAGKATLKVYNLNNREHLMAFEYRSIYQLEDNYDNYIFEEEGDDWRLFVGEVIDFLSYYKEFQLDNYDNWFTVNENVIEIISTQEIKEQEVSFAYYEQYAKVEAERRKKHFIKRWLFYILFIIPFLFALYMAIKYRAYIHDNNLSSGVTIFLVLILIKTTNVIINKSNER